MPMPSLSPWLRNWMRRCSLAIQSLRKWSHWYRYFGYVERHLRRGKVREGVDRVGVFFVITSIL